MKPRRPGRGKKPAARRSPNKLFVVFGIVAGLALLYGWNSVFLGPQGEQAAKVKAQLAAAKTDQKNLQRQLGQLQKLANETQVREAEIARLGQLVPANPDVAGAILALNDAANQAHVAWSSFTPSPATATAATSGPVPLGIAMKIAGSFDQIFDYLGRLETLDRLVVVDAIQLGGGGNGQSGGQMSADIKARMFSGGTAAAPATTVAGASTTTPSGTSALPKVGG